jgi:type I restriction enzyme S subunit
MSFPRYARYKESGVEWLGYVPEHWKVTRFRHVFRESQEKIEDEVVGPMLSVSGYRGIEIKNYDDENRRRSDEDLIGYRIVRTGQLVVNTMWLNYAGLGVSEFEGHVSPAYRSYWITGPLNGRFAHHLMRSGIYVQGYARLLTGIRPNSLQISREDLMDFPVICPPEADQTVIAEFLDVETAKIDALIAEQQRLIDLLDEKRQAVISRAVARGLNPDAPMKPSGIEWLGDVPAHWSIPPLYLRYEILLGKMLDEKRITGENLVPYVRNADVQWDFIRTTDLPVMDIAPHERERYTLKVGDLLVCEGGEVGRTAVWDGPLDKCGYQKALHRLRPLSMNEHPRYFYYCMRFAAATGIFLAEGNPNTIPHLTGEKLRLYRFPKPPSDEQRAIAEFLDAESSHFDNLIREAERTTALLQERRAALISAAVTGKIDVRGLVEAA